MDPRKVLNKREKGLRHRVHKRFILQILSVFFAAIFLIIGLILFMGSAMDKKISETKIKELVEEKKISFGRDLENIHACLEILKGWANSGLLHPASPREMIFLLGPVIDAFPQFSSIKIADMDGNMFIMHREKEAYQVVLNKPGDGDVVEVQEWKKDEANGWEMGKSEAGVSMSLSDERNSSWVKQAFLSPGVPIWSKVYIPIYGNEMVSTLSLGNKSSVDKTKMLVVAIDVLSKQILSQIESVRIGYSGTTFFFDGNRNIFALKGVGSGNKGVFDIVDIFRPEESNANPAAMAALAWLGSGRTDEPVSFRFLNEDYWVILAPVSHARHNILIGIVAKGISLFDMRSFKARKFLLTFGLVVLASFSLFFVIAYRYNKKIKTLSPAIIEAKPSEEEILALISKGEGAHIEFKSTVRMNLNTGRIGKEIELAWLKSVAAFLNSQGGILLLGVNDQGLVSGLEEDGFENDDKCLLHLKNLIQQHIGMEHMPCMSFELCVVSDKMVGVVTCEPANGPVFLRTKNEEAFYIRSGPSSVQLPISQTLEYLRQRSTMTQ